MLYKTLNGRTLIGLIEPITIIWENDKKMTILAKIDTGASKSSIDSNLTRQLGLDNVLKSRIIKSAHGNKLRPIIEAEVHLAKKEFKAEFTVADRSHMTYQVLVGVNILKHGFFIDNVAM